MQFVDFERFTSSYHTKLHEKSCYYLNNVHEKIISESQDKRNFESLRALFVICTRFQMIRNT